MIDNKHFGAFLVLKYLEMMLDSTLQSEAGDAG
jgi:hypothetical protein